jgi:FkbM family methyltransferase
MTSIIQRIRNRISSTLFHHFAIPRSKEGVISKAVVKKYLPAKPVIIDCGAHDGGDTVELADILKGEVHAFEPVAEIYDRLLKYTANCKNVHCYQVALSNKDGVQDFYLSEGEFEMSDMSSSLMEPKEHLVDHPGIQFKKKISVQSLTLDSWAAMNNIEKVDMLWLDMQGFELNMLKASERILPTVKVIYTEVSLKETYKGVPLYPEYKQYLEAQGFKVLMEEINIYPDMGNVLFVRNI